MSDAVSSLEQGDIERIAALAKSTESGDHSESERLLDELTRRREATLFHELGHLTRQFHEALNTFRLDSRITTLAEKEFPDAKQRLRHVITMTGESADKSLTAAEESLPICKGLGIQAQAFNQAWGRFTQREMSAEEFRGLSHQMGDFFTQVEEGSDRVANNLNAVILAQDFQDLTGQIISRVITLVDEMELSLVELVRISGGKILVNEDEVKDDKGLKAQGPAVPGVDNDGVVGGQDDVDDLLSSLGF